MLIEFRVANFRSINSEQVLSLVPSSDTDRRDTHLLGTGFGPVPELLSSAAIYGPNASGKSNILLAMNFMQLMVSASAQHAPDAKLNHQPFRFQDNPDTVPSSLEMDIVVNSVRYRYGFSYTAERFHEEWLYVYEKPRPQKWFERKYDGSSDKYSFSYGAYMVGDRKTWEKATRPNALYLSTAVQLNSQSLMELYSAITKDFSYFDPGMQPHDEFILSFIKDDQLKTVVVDKIKAADLGIVDVVVKSLKAPKPKLTSSEGETKLSFEISDIEQLFFLHNTGKFKSEIHKSLESPGTVKYLSFIAHIYKQISSSGLLVVDELEAHLHPLLVKELIALYNDPELNTKGAQLIFTCHNTALLSQEIFRRDQIWFTEKDSELETHLYPLLDFSPRKGEALEKGYMEGRYGALPIIGDARE